MKNSIKSKPLGTGQPAQPNQRAADSASISKQPSNGLLSRAQVARRLGVCTHTVARNKELIPIKFNARLVRYRAQDVDRLIESALAGGGSGVR